MDLKRILANTIVGGTALGGLAAIHLEGSGDVRPELRNIHSAWHRAPRPNHMSPDRMTGRIPLDEDKILDLIKEDPGIVDSFREMNEDLKRAKDRDPLDQKPEGEAL